jgi:hypothetical protein
MESMSIGSILIWFLFFLILALPGYLIEKQIKQGIRLRQKARTWPVVDGIVADTSIEEGKRRTGGRDIFGFARRITVYKPVIHYSYRVGDKSFVGSRYKNGWSGEWDHPNRSMVETILQAYSPGKLVGGHYDPFNPAQAYLELESSDVSLYFLRLIGFAFLLGAIVVLAFGIKNLTQSIMAEREVASIVSSGAVIPVTTSQIKTRLKDDLKLTCQSEGFPGLNIAYRGWSCKKSADTMLPDLQIYSRKDEPEKVDLIWLTTSQENPEENQKILKAVIAIVFSESDSLAAQQWCLGLLASGQSKSRTDNIINGIPLTLDFGETRLNLMIGDSK